jgi:putative Mn2+ efflux pump MntP
MLAETLRVALVAISLALDVFAVSIGVGMRGVANADKIRIGLAFAAAEVGMNLVGAGIGAAAGRAIGSVAAYLGFAALVAVGIYMIIESLRAGDEQGFDLSRGWGLLAASLSISLDSLGIGFSIVYIGVPLVVTLSAIAVASLTSTGLGLAFGKRFGATVGERAGLFAGIVLIATGALFAVLKYENVG